MQIHIYTGKISKKATSYSKSTDKLFNPTVWFPSSIKERYQFHLLCKVSTRIKNNLSETRGPQLNSQLIIIIVSIAGNQVEQLLVIYFLSFHQFYTNYFYSGKPICTKKETRTQALIIPLFDVKSGFQDQRCHSSCAR